MLSVFVRTVLMYIFLTLALRLMGKRQVGELEVTELVSALLLSEIATMAIDDSEEPIVYAIVPIFCILFLEVMVSFGATKIPFVKKMFEGKPSILIRNGKLNQKELGKIRMSLEELMGELRLQGITAIGDVDYAILEQNGKLSVIPIRIKQPLTPNDMKQTPERTGIDHALVIDGAIQENNCKQTGHNEQFVMKILKKYHCRLNDAFLLTVDDSGSVTLIRKEEDSS